MSSPSGGRDEMGRYSAESKDTGDGHVRKHSVQPGSRHGVLLVPFIIRAEGATRSGAS